MASRPEGEKHVIALDGELDIATVAQIDTELARVEAGECEQIVMDLRELQFLDSTGIQMLVKAHARCADRGREISILLEPGPVRRVLEVAGVLDVLARPNRGAVAA
jgi:anti-sigma B factor antagonist